MEFSATAADQGAWKQVAEWLGLPVVWVPAPGEQHAHALASLIPRCNHPNRVHDADLAALAISHGLTSCSTEEDVGRFPGVPWTNPLTS